MKTSFLLVFPCLLFAFTANLLLASAANDEVLDINGHPLRAGTEYYILPFVWGAGGGGLLLHPRTINGCPIDVVQSPSDLNRGLPVTFTPVNPEKNSIQVSTALNINFTAIVPCARSTLWKLYPKKLGSVQRFVTIDGVEGSPFQIEKFERDYKLRHCPPVCNTCRPLCSDLGIAFQEGSRHLALNTGNVFRVVFRKA